MGTFYNPYHFVPVAKRETAQQICDIKREELGSGAATHDRYVDGAHSGEIVCRLTTVTPMVVGSTQTRLPGQVANVEPYARDGRPAIPASSLRGMVSSLVESASSSALRILTPSHYSFRKAFDPTQTLSAIGILVGQGDTLQLKPLALPTLNAVVDRNNRPTGQFAVPPRFRRIFPRPAFKTYVGNYNEIRSASFVGRTSPSEKHVAPWNLRQLAYSGDKVDDHACLHCKPNPGNRKFLVAQDPERDVPVRDGLYRVLGCWGDRREEIPEGKKHELWLPVPGTDVKPIAIDPVAIERFHDLADERTDASLKAKLPVMPFHPLDTPRNSDPTEYGQKFRLKAGDLVYFEVSEAGVAIEIALAAIWRGRVETADGKPAGAHQFFSSVDPDLVPFQPGRERITIAEQMFGFVEEDFHHKEPAEGTLAFASRIRFTDGTLTDAAATREGVLEPTAVTLRILSSPKPPSPALYFKPAAGSARWIGKSQLKPATHHPQGRKTYLHQFSRPDQRPWETATAGEHNEQKNAVRPVRRGCVFEFRVIYDNLTDAELGLLLYGLKPDEGFHHKLGMGKPLGLGSVKVEVVQVKEIDRMTRYTLEGLRRTRADVMETHIAVRDAVVASGLVGQQIHKAICLMGDIRKAPPAGSVHPPTLADQASAEGETFKWFVANDGGLVEKSAGEQIPKQQKYLKPLPESPGTLPTLPRFEWEDIPPRR
jgi:hypothetical protein